MIAWFLPVLANIPAIVSALGLAFRSQASTAPQGSRPR